MTGYTFRMSGPRWQRWTPSRRRRRRPARLRIPGERPGRHALEAQLQFVGRPSNKDEPVMGQGRNAAFKGWLRTATRRLQTDPS